MDWNLLIILIPVLPLLGFVANGLFGKWLGRSGGWLAVICMGSSALVSMVLFLGSIGGSTKLPIQVNLWEWIAVADLNVTLGFHVDQLTALMLFFITLVSTLVFLYSVGYMKGDPGYNRFFAYLCLFDFSMLILVLGDSLPLLFVGWEGVGLCSYLLIGYYMSMKGAPDAGKKAFIVNRIGDFGFLIAMFMLYFALGTLNIQEIIQKLNEHHPLLAYGAPFVTVLTLMLFVGCCGKSAQIPLFVWLPDAMAGPTPVSALIHAATMVTAGVYLMVRMSAVFALAPTTLVIVAIIGCATAFVAGTIALTQRDIKKVLAYSTCSQLGYMFLACGCGAYVAAIFHVFTHAFFKACLFLGAGSVIHAAHHEQDMFRMGGLKKWMPRTHWTFLIGCLGLAGFPLLAGFFSKDEILWKTFSSGLALGKVLWIVGILTAVMTAFYSFRAYFLTFQGECRLDEDTKSHLHESPWTMTVPLIILAAGTVIAGYTNLPAGILHTFGSHADHGAIGTFLEPVVGQAHQTTEHYKQVGAAAHGEHSLVMEWLLMGLSTIIVIGTILFARNLYCSKGPAGGKQLVQVAGPLYRLSYNKWWWDDFYLIFVAGTLNVIACLANWFDKRIIDGVLHFIAEFARVGSRMMRGLQNGQVQAYALAILIGVNLIVFIAIFCAG
jgi:NADH-quinone oxidoreductase subunit L